MHSWRTILALVFLLTTLGVGQTADAAAQVAAGTEAAAGAATEAAGKAKAEDHHGLTPNAPRFSIGPLQFTSSTVISWCVAALLILIAQLATRNVQMVPAGLQNFMEWLVEGLYGFFGEILGAELVKKTFWFFCTIFLFILVTNWIGLIPGVGTVGLGHYEAGHFHLDKPFLRGGNADLNMTLAMSLTFFFLWAVWSFQALGAGGIVKHLFSSGDTSKGLMPMVIAAVFIVVGVIEIISIMFRPVSLSFRLYGNIFAGENILETMMSLIPALGWILPLPFYFLELLVGLVQALVFALLTSVFTSLMCAHHDDGHAEGHGHGEKKAAH